MNPKFVSFFFHNGQWANSRFANGEGRRTAYALHVVPVSNNVLSYQPAEVLTPRRLLNVYTQLSKTRLSILIVLTTMSGLAVSPFPTTISTLLSTAAGTALCSASANSLNQLQEVPFDAQMARTRTRPLVRKAISPLHATAFSVATGVAGPALLWAMVNPTTAMLGVANIILYAGLYTWMKRRSIWNTCIGAVVGGIPPVMGWTACGGHLIPLASCPVVLSLPSFLSSTPLPLMEAILPDTPLAPLALFMLLYSWQYPHFNSLSHLVRGSYAQAGYQMLSVISPVKNTLVAFRHSVLLVPICSALIPMAGLTTWAFALSSLTPNIILTYAAWRFWHSGGEKEARMLWQHSLWYLPVVLGLMMFHKRGMDWLQYIGLGEEKPHPSRNVV